MTGPTYVQWFFRSSRQMGSCLSTCIKKGERLIFILTVRFYLMLFSRFRTCFSKGPNPDDLKMKRRSMRLPADIGKYSYYQNKILFQTTYICPNSVLGVELGLGMTKTTNQYPQSQIIENFFSIDETELHYKNYHMKRIPIIQCRVKI